MASAKLSIIIDAEVEQATKAIQELADVAGIELKKGESVIGQFEDSIKKLEASVKSAKTPEELAKYGKSLAVVKQALTDIRGVNKPFDALAASVGKVGAVTPQAGNAVLNLGRIAQDASFGFIGVANNIEPFIASLGQLKQQSGTTGGAVKAFFSSLAGPAGFGVFLGGLQLLDAYINGYGVFAGGAKKAANAQAEFSKEVDTATASALSAGIQLQELAKIAGDASQADTVRANALKQVNEETSKYGITITQAGIASGQAAIEIDKLTASLVQQAVAAKFADKVADLKVKEAQLTKTVAEAAKGEIEAKTALVNLDRKKTDQALIAQQVELSGIQSAKQKTKANEELSLVQTELASTSDLYRTALEKSLVVVEKDKAATGGLNAAKKESNLLTQEQVDKENEAIAAAQQRLTIRKQEALITATELEQAKRKLELDKQSKIINAPVGTISTTGKGPAQGATDALAANNEILESNREAQAAVLANAETIQGILAPAVESVFTAIAEGDNVFKAVTDAIKKMVVQLALAVAQALIFKAIMAALTGGGSTIGSVGKGFLGGLLGRATGGPMFSGMPTIVGETGPELIMPSSSGTIVPTSQMGGGGTLSTRIRGNNLLFVLDRAAKTSKMNFV